ncbi:MAG: protein-tyrosine phosphatase-like protein [Piptocephalis tieghemiana]|nr:MAG: protein-tyrosine phosphatase-like protein [Piptocephalis tieghemiana]
MSNDLTPILPDLFIGSLAAAQSKELLLDHGITHILNITDQPVATFSDSFKYLLISAYDVEETNILAHLDQTYNFIHQVLSTSQGRVLVHCHAGVSRSASVVVAYLMRSLNLGFDEALEQCRQARPVVCPNEGFEEQLRVYAASNYILDPLTSSAYRRFLQHRYAQQAQWGTQTREDLASLLLRTTSSQSTSASFTLRCKKCRSTLVTDEQIIEHAPGQGQAAFAYRRRDSPLSGQGRWDGRLSSQCTTYHVEPTQWIWDTCLGDDGELMGRIDCPKCRAKLGSWDWRGSPCSCGSWITPAFALIASKVDRLANIPSVSKDRLAA